MSEFHPFSVPNLPKVRRHPTAVGYATVPLARLFITAGSTPAPLFQLCFTFFSSVKQASVYNSRVADLSDFDQGIVVGLLIAGASFGGDGKQPQVTVRMHVRHEALFGWLMARFPETRLYGPYHHGGRSYYQWMARGTALVRDLLPLLEGRLDSGIDAPAAERLDEMCRRYAGYIARERERLGLGAGGRHG
jgi:hypothetical protein